MAETLALKEGLKFGMSRGVCRIVIEGDVQLLLEDFQKLVEGQLKDRDATKSEGSSFFQRKGAKIDKCGFTPKKAFHRALHRSVLLKGLFKPKPLLPDDLVRRLRSLLLNSNPDFAGTKRPDKIAEINELLFKMKSVLYGSDEFEPVAEACARLTQEFFRDNTLRLLIIYLPQLELEARNDATQVIANLQRQQVNSRIVASDYLEANLDLMDHLMSGYDNPDIALHYGSMLRVCARHQSATKYVLQTKYIIKLFDYMQCPSFGIATDATATFKELLTRHKSAVAEFLSQNYNWFFDEFNSKLLESSNYITRRQAVKLLGDILLDLSNSPIMVRYVSSIENLRISMNLLRESSKSIQIDAFHVFKLFVANEKKPAEIVSIVVANRSKLLRLFDALKMDKEDEQFEADKAQVVTEISRLKL